MNNKFISEIIPLLTKKKKTMEKINSFSLSKLCKKYNVDISEITSKLKELDLINDNGTLSTTNSKKYVTEKLTSSPSSEQVETKEEEKVISPTIETSIVEVEGSSEEESDLIKSLRAMNSDSPTMPTMVSEVTPTTLCDGDTSKLEETLPLFTLDSEEEQKEELDLPKESIEEVKSEQIEENATSIFDLGSFEELDTKSEEESIVEEDKEIKVESQEEKGMFNFEGTETISEEKEELSYDTVEVPEESIEVKEEIIVEESKKEELPIEEVKDTVVEEITKEEKEETKNSQEILSQFRPQTETSVFDSVQEVVVPSTNSDMFSQQDFLETDTKVTQQIEVTPSSKLTTIEYIAAGVTLILSSVITYFIF